MGYNSTCIYCSKPIDTTRGQGDHVVTSMFGRFKDAHIFRRLCKDCNTELGKCEEQLIRCGPESVVLSILRPPVLRSNRGRGKAGGAHGASRPHFQVQHATHTETVIPHPSIPGTTTPINQLVMRMRNGQQITIALFPKMTLASLKRRIGDINPANIEQSMLHCDEEHFDHFWRMLKTTWPKGDFVEGQSTPAGTHRYNTKITFVVTPFYFRALAKTAFHYYLVNSKRQYTGAEPIFDTLRRFIRHGQGEASSFFREIPGQMTSPFRNVPGGCFLPNRYCHLLAVDEQGPKLTAVVQLFVGPENPSPPYHLVLADLSNTILWPQAVSAHCYIYGISEDKRYAGKVIPLRCTRLRTG